MTSPSDAFNQAIAGVNDFFTPASKNAALTYTRPKTPVSAPAKNYGEQTVNPSKQPKGTIFGAPQTPQSKALQAKK